VALHNRETYTDQAFAPWLYRIPQAEAAAFIASAQALVTEADVAEVNVHLLDERDLGQCRRFVQASLYAERFTDRAGDSLPPEDTGQDTAAMSDAAVRQFIQDSAVTPAAFEAEQGVPLTGRRAALEAIYRTEEDLQEDRT